MDRKLSARFFALLFALTSNIFLQLDAFAFPAQLGLSPDNNRRVLQHGLEAAEQEIIINAYQFENEKILEMLKERISDGITLKLLIDGQPLGSISSNAKRLLQSLHQAMKNSENADHRIYLMYAEPGSGLRRYRYNHAKYVLIDESTAYLTSENFSKTGHGEPGKKGNRGWSVLLENSEINRSLRKIFKEDTSSDAPDILTYTPRTSLIFDSNELYTFGTESNAETQIVSLSPTHNIPEKTVDISKARLITSPHSFKPLLELFRSARDSLRLQHLSLSTHWRDENGQKTLNPLVWELVEAARSKIQIQVLLNDERAFGAYPDPDNKKGNYRTVDLLQRYAYCEDLPLVAKIMDLGNSGLTYVHNKGILVDDTSTFVGSINGTQNSMEENRETGVILESPEANSYFGNAYEVDWNSTEEVRHTYGPADCPPSTLISFFRLSWLR